MPVGTGLVIGVRTGIVLVLLVVLLTIVSFCWVKPSTVEPFVTVDLDTLKAQRQMLQWEGEHRYNDIGRLQAPGSSLDANTVNAAVSHTLPAPTGFTDLLSTLRGAVGLGAQAAPSGATATEQTGGVQAKITFCESQPIDCSLFGPNQDPRMAECGFCHRDGIDSTGKPHRGGMFISSDDQIRANEKARASGGKALYQPTIGKCAPQNFTVQGANCKAREAQLQCQQAGGPTLNNECGQCYGGGPGAAGLLYVGPKPRTFTAILWVSHPGAHSNNGSGMTVQVQSATNGARPVLNVPYSNRQLLDPQQIPLTNIAEGDTITISMVGAPALWCGWLSSPDGKRTVSLDIGQQSITPADGFVIAGDKRSGPVTQATGATDSDMWAFWGPIIPATVLWYQRRETVPGAVASAWYGAAIRPSTTGVDVTDVIKSALGANVPLSNNLSFLHSGDPAPGILKHLWIQQDNGGTFIWTSASVDRPAGDPWPPAATFQNTFQLVSQLPATLVAPAFSDDVANCPTGPMVFTPVGAGLMGSHSCFKADGSFNPTPYCLQELWTGAGGTLKGTGYPTTVAAANALVVNNSLDDTVAALNNQGSIALYGMDMNGKAADFIAFKAASLFMLGTVVANPCDGPQAATGPQTPECLDYLWRTATGPQPSGPLTVDPSTLPYAGCNANGFAAPLNADGTPNATNVAAANAQGGVAAIRAFFAAIFGRAQDSSNYDAQVTAMRDCYNANIKPPPPTPDACPRPNPDEWQPAPKPEVYQFSPDGYYSLKSSAAPAACATFGAVVASPAQIKYAQEQGASWCSLGWASDGASYFPMTAINAISGPGCGSTGVNGPGSGDVNGNAAANCFGVKPPPNTANVLPWSPQAWSSQGGVPVMREIKDMAQCAVDLTKKSGANVCASFDTAESAQAWIQSQPVDAIQFREVLQLYNGPLVMLGPAIGTSWADAVPVQYQSVLLDGTPVYIAAHTVPGSDTTIFMLTVYGEQRFVVSPTVLFNPANWSSYTLTSGYMLVTPPPA